MNNGYENIREEIRNEIILEKQRRVILLKEVVQFMMLVNI